MRYDLISERCNVLHRSVGHLKAMARETNCEVERMKLNMVAQAMADISNKEIAKAGVR